MNTEFDPVFIPIRRPNRRRRGSAVGRLLVLLGALAGATAMWLVVIEFAFWLVGLGL